MSNRSSSVPENPATGIPDRTVWSSGWSGEAARASTLASADGVIRLSCDSPLPSKISTPPLTPSRASTSRVAAAPPANVGCLWRFIATSRAIASAMSSSLWVSSCSTSTETGGDCTAPSRMGSLGRRRTRPDMSRHATAREHLREPLRGGRRRVLDAGVYWGPGVMRPASSSSAVTGATSPSGEK